MAGVYPLSKTWMNEKLRSQREQGVRDSSNAYYSSSLLRGSFFFMKSLQKCMMTWFSSWILNAKVVLKPVENFTKKEMWENL